MIAPTQEPALRPRRSLPNTFEEYQNLHDGETILVCGCGSSLNLIESLPPNLVTIGVNDIGRKFDPNYLVILNGMSTFDAERKSFITNSRAQTVFSQLRVPLENAPLVRFNLGSRGGTVIDAPGFTVPYTNNSPYVGICLARFMGAKRIGLIGVDFTDNHFFGDTGQHSLLGTLGKMNREYETLRSDYERDGIEIFNLSPDSLLDSLPKAPLESFLNSAEKTNHAAQTTDSLNIVSYATTPVAGVPSILARCIQEKTQHNATCVWQTGDYGNGVCYEGGLSWKQHPGEATELLEAADLVIAHNGKISPTHAALLANKPILTLAHNYKWNVDCRFFDQGQPGLVVSQYQATLDEFKNWIPVPNPIPLWEPDHQTGPKNERITICYTPSGKHERYPKHHRLYWHSKGYDTTMRVLEDLARRYPIDLEVIRERQISHKESLAMKLRSHIVIDECVTGSYHRNSLEGLAAGAVVVNGFGILPELETVFRNTTFNPPSIPFRRSTLETLEPTLQSLIESGLDSLEDEGSTNRDWMEKHWDFSRQWDGIWMPTIERALADSKKPAKASKPKPSASNASISIVIPHGGSERLSLFKACLAELRQCAGSFELIIVEMSKYPLAKDIAKEFNASYVFIENDGPFERARALNIGTGLASGDYVLWMDNDVLLPKRFLQNALEEAQEHGLDFLIPFTSIQYLNESDTLQVCDKSKALKSCIPMRQFTCRENFGCIGLVKKSFVKEFGGLDEGFIGWGGEDNAWNHKAHLLGKASSTRRLDQVVYHLYHPDSGATSSQLPHERNEHYHANVRLMRRLASVRNPQQFLSRFPKPTYDSCPWKPSEAFEILIPIAQSARFHPIAKAVAQGLESRFGIQATIRDAKDASDTPSTPRSLAIGFPLESSQGEPLTVHKSRLFLFEGSMPRNHETKGYKPHSQPLSLIADADTQGKLSLVAQPEDIAKRLVPMLSLCASKEPPVVVETEFGKRIRALNGRVTWLYWEGPCPDWIVRCRETIEKHAPNFTLIDREQFDSLWQEDRELDIDSLEIAHRADYIRSYLLRTYGGLWLDSDCIVMKSLDPIFELLETLEFVAHKEEKSRLYSNGFIASRPRSRIAEQYYQKVRNALRSGPPRSWSGLGAEPLTAVLKSHFNRFHELETQSVQPICWSQSKRFFQTGTKQEHQRNYQSEPFCYMLYNTAFQRHLKSHPSAQLMGNDTFFDFLLQQALATEEPTMNRHSELPTRLHILRTIAPKRLLDIFPRTPRWGLLAQEFSPAGQTNPTSQYAFNAIMDPNEPSPHGLLQAYHGISGENPADYLAMNKGDWDLIILSGFSNDKDTQQTSLLEIALEKSDYVVVEISDNSLPPAGQVPILRSTSNRDQASGRSTHTLLFSLKDPCNLRDQSIESKTFEDAANTFRSLGSESLSGPGSSLHQTQVIRNALPDLFRELEIKSILDVPCGDFNWFQYVLDEQISYTGVDIVGTIVENNQKQYGSKNRRFVNLDATRDTLPKADLIFCRDMLVHLPVEAIFRFFQNAKNSGCHYIITTTFGNPRINHDIEAGDWRPLNLYAEPFNFPTPLKIINERCTEANGEFADKSLALWELATLPTRVETHALAEEAKATR